MKTAFAIFFMLVLIASCSEPTDELNPNGMSEMALLMEKMSKDLNVTKHKLESGQVARLIPDDYNGIFVAETTKEDVIDDEFKSFAKAYIAAVKVYSTSLKKERIKAFNGILTACRQCHENLCPGPIDRINSMVIKE